MIMHHMRYADGNIVNAILTQLEDNKIYAYAISLKNLRNSIN